MSGDAITLLAIGLFVVLLFAEVPVAWALGISGALGVVLLKSFGVATSVLASVPFEASSKFSLIVIPMYILLGVFMMWAGIPERLYALANRAARRLPGGIGMATIAACAGFSAVSGSSVATAATIAKVSVSEMRRHGYRDSFAAGIVAIAGTLGILIPPSIPLVIYAIITGESVAALYAAGIIPGIISSLAFMIVIYLIARRRGSIAPENVADSGLKPPVVTRSQGIQALVVTTIIFLVVMVGLYSGLTTPSESAALSAVLALVAVLLEARRWKRGETVRNLFAAMKESAGVTSMSFGILIGAGIFTYFLVSARVPSKLSEFLTTLDVPPLAVVGLILLATIPLGMFLDATSILVITVPLTYPALMELGFDGVWYGILLVKMIEISLITPPVGLNAFVVSAASGVRLERVFWGSVPFIVCELVLVLLFLFVPATVTFLPDFLATLR